MSNIIFSGFDEVYVDGKVVSSTPVDVDVTDSVVEYGLHVFLRENLENQRKIRKRLEQLIESEKDERVNEIVEIQIEQSKVLGNLIRLIIGRDLLLDME